MNLPTKVPFVPVMPRQSYSHSCEGNLSLYDRRNAVAMMRESGATYKKIAEHFDFSIERARQVVARQQRDQRNMEASSYFLACAAEIADLDLYVVTE